ncbi:hypothetical protein H6P81_019859 [Aristolochia fimbriata]|uniref:Breast cancer type 2 susceptibility protein n=1 Tax=Aristolochia fimbriata TaxID=158543 RepID=A0AAV7DTS6_ARIFI|nr:hypothetical protein H6P81_019859 [Aristolochia fimbriata]
MQVVETSSQYSNWQIIADTGGRFKWKTGRPDSGITMSRANEGLTPASNGSLAPLPSMYDLLIQGPPQQSCNDVPAFRTGSGKPVTIKESSIQKAMAVVGEWDVTGSGSSMLLEDNCQDAPMFRTGSGKSIPLKQSAVRKAMSVLGEGVTKDSGCGSNSSLSFRAGGGQKIDVSHASLIRAKTLLQLDENFESYAPEGTRTALNAGKLCNMDKTRDLERTDPFSRPEGIQVSRKEGAQFDTRGSYTSMKHWREDGVTNFLQPELCGSGSKEPQILFHTAGGRSVSVSSNAVKRARSLLGDIDVNILPVKTGSSEEERPSHGLSLNKERVSYASSVNHNSGRDKLSMNNSLPTKWSVHNQQQPSSLSGPFSRENGTMKQTAMRSFVSEATSVQKNSISSLEMLHRDKTPQRRQLHDISTDKRMTSMNQNTFSHEKRKLIMRSSPFKRPRRSQFSAPLQTKFSLLPSGSSTDSTSEASCCSTKVSTRYPFRYNRISLKEFFGGPPVHLNLLGQLSNKVKCVNLDIATHFTFFMRQGSERIGIGYFQHMLAQSGASLRIVTKEWVTNHYKWIIWKLASLEQGYPSKACGKFLTVFNVLEELKYRYEREVNHGHRSALKRILEGDASPGCMVVLCISAVHSFPDTAIENVDPLSTLREEKLDFSHGPQDRCVAKIELTDGWYSVNAHLDAALSRKLLDGELFVGQKLRICGARLCGWIGPVSSLEASQTVSFLLHVNGTYRAHWAERLGFSKGFVTPLAFRCIKPAGGPVPRTLVGITRVYPIIYKERLADGTSILRSQKMEFHMLQQYDQRRLSVAEGVRNRQNDLDVHSIDDYNDSDEAAKICRFLETAMDPEIIMADMTSEQLKSIAAYQAKQEEIRQSRLQKKIEEAFINAGLGERQVTPLMRVRVVSLTGKDSRHKRPSRDGLITIWSPTENLVADLVEGQAYTVEGLVPLNSEANVLHLQARGSSTKWRRLSPSAAENFEPFFTPRKAASILNFCQVPPASEFDIVAVVVYVGEIFGSGRQKKQWVFLTDGSLTGSDAVSRGFSSSLLAVSFSFPPVYDEMLVPVSSHLEGSTVGFCNLIKRTEDALNHIWAAEATENSIYYLHDKISGCSYLKEVAQTVNEWAKVSSLTIQRLKERVLRMICVHDS